MSYGGKIKEGSRIYFPRSLGSNKKFASDIVHAAFHDQADVGIVTSTSYSFRRGVGSALGLLSTDALNTYLQEGNLCDDSSLLAVNNEDNGKFYVGCFRVILPI